MEDAGTTPDLDDGSTSKENDRPNAPRRRRRSPSGPQRSASIDSPTTMTPVAKKQDTTASPDALEASSEVPTSRRLYSRASKTKGKRIVESAACADAEGSESSDNDEPMVSFDQRIKFPVATDPRELFEAFAVPEWMYKNLPSCIVRNTVAKACELVAESVDARPVQVMTSFLTVVLAKSIDIVCRPLSRILKILVAKKLVTDLNSSAVANSDDGGGWTNPASSLRELVEEVEPAAMSRSEKEANYDAMLQYFSDRLSIIPPSSEEAASIRALLCVTHSNSQMQSIGEKHVPLKLGKHAIRTARAKGLDAKECVDVFVKPARTYERISRERLKFAVEYMLLPVNVGSLSWGRKKVKVGKRKKKLELPCLPRKRTTEHVFKDYLVACKKSNMAPIGRSTFFAIFGMATVSGGKLLTAIDYVTASCINEPIGTIQTIVDDIFCDDKAIREKCTRLLSLLKNFLKVQYDRHVRMDDDVGTHGCSFCLGKEEDLDVSQRVRESTCVGCNFVPYVLDFIVKQIKAKREAARSKLGDMDIAMPELGEEGTTPSNEDSADVSRVTDTVDVLDVLDVPPASRSDEDNDDSDNENMDAVAAAPADRSAEDGDAPDNDTVDAVAATPANRSAEDGDAPDNDTVDPPVTSLTESYEAQVDDAIAFIEDAAVRMECYMAHRVRVVNQQKKIDDMHQQLRQACQDSKKDGTTMFVHIDWKMKYEPKSSAEPTLAHYGKRGMSWHGAYIVFYKYKDGKAVKHKMYLDQIMTGSSKQDSLSVLAMVEALVVQLQHMFPQMEDIWLQSDNAGCYHKKDLTLFIPILNAHYRLKISQVIHTETQDGKGLIDAHFAHASMWLQRFLLTVQVNKVNTINTEWQLAEALCWRGGMPNSFVQLVRCNRNRLDAVNKALAKSSDSGDEYFSRANHYIYNVPEDSGKEWKSLDLTKEENWTKATYQFRVFAHSGIGDGVLFQVDVGAGTFTHEVSEDADDDSSKGSGQDEDDEIEEDDESVGDDSDFEEEEEDSDDDSDADSLDSWLEDEDVMEELFGSEGDGVLVEPMVASFQPENLCTGVTLEGVSKKTLDSIPAICGICTPAAGSSTASSTDTTGPAVGGEVVEGRDAITMAMNMIADELGSEGSVDIHDGQEDMAEYQEAATFEAPPKRGGWGRRGMLDTLYGKMYMELYKEDVDEMFERGERDKSEKMSPAQMVEQLRRKYPGRYCLPSESEVQRYVSSLVQRKNNKKKKAKKGEGDEVGDARYKMPIVVRMWLREYMAQNNFDVSPSKTADLTRTHFESLGELPNGFPDRKQLSSAVSGMKSTHRKNAEKELKRALL